MTAKHSPTPWKGDGLEIIAADDYSITCIPDSTEHEGGRPGEDQANAARILACVNACEGIDPAAVPELLAACRSMLLSSPYADLGRECECGEFEDLKTCPHVEARAAIAKAEGRA